MQAGLAALVEHGLSPQQALITATRNNARLMGLAGDIGTLEVGKFADRVMLRDDPLADISNVREIEAVMQGRAVGRVAQTSAQRATSQRSQRRLTAPLSKFRRTHSWILNATTVPPKIRRDRCLYLSSPQRKSGFRT